MPEEVKALTVDALCKRWDKLWDAWGEDIPGAAARFIEDLLSLVDARVAEIAVLKQEREESAKADAEVQETIKRYMDDAARLEVERDSAVNETARKCARAACGLCASERGWPVVERTEYVSEDGGATTAPVTYLAHETDEGYVACRAERIRRAFPEAFGKEGERG